MKTLSRSFYNRPTLTVARELLGARLVRILDGVRLAGIITEAEAYISEEDLGCHAKSGKTKRNAAMYGPPGHAYVYFTYGMHWMLNAVTEREGFPAAVLIRAMEVVEGADIISARRQRRDTTGPAKLTQALGIDAALNGVSLCDPDEGLWIEAGTPVAGSDIITSPRVGLYTVPEPWKSVPWRFQMRRR
ncbi:MAG: DNA-3-methyladenine glycosylase [Anaerolineales bacterium]|nr:DNA-3-methyladenine glycosylase [Anaerolineales bacterium]